MDPWLIAHPFIYLLFLQRGLKKNSVEKDLRSTQGEGGDNNAQVKYIILFPHVIQSMV